MIIFSKSIILQKRKLKPGNANDLASLTQQQESFLTLRMVLFFLFSFGKSSSLPSLAALISCNCT